MHHLVGKLMVGAHVCVGNLCTFPSILMQTYNCLLPHLKNLLKNFFKKKKRKEINI